MPHERIFGSRPSLEGIPVFDQTVVVRTPEPIRRKHYRFNGRGNIGGFVGFSDEIRGYRVYVPSHGKPIKETTDVVILDSMLVDEVVLEDDQEPLNQGEDVDDDAAPSINERNSAPVYTQDAERILHDTSWSPEEVEAANGVSELTRRRRSERVSARNIGPAFLCLAEVIREPLTVREARQSPQWHSWKTAIRTEIKALEANHTFVLVGPPSWSTHPGKYHPVPHQDWTYWRNSAVQGTCLCTGRQADFSARLHRHTGSSSRLD